MKEGDRSQGTHESKSWYVCDRKYLRDSEREELSREALSLSVQALRKKVTEAKTVEDQKSALIDAFKIYKRCNKSWEQKQSLFVTLLTDAYSQFKKEVSNNSNSARQL